MEQRTLLTHFPVDSTLFSPLQLQPRTILSLGMNNAWRWLESHVGVSFPSFVRDYQHGLVIVSLDITYLEPKTIFDSDCVDVLSHPVMVRRNGMILQVGFDFLGSDGRSYASVTALCVLLKVSGTDASLSAKPARLDQRILERFLPQEIDPTPTPKVVSAAIAALDASGIPALDQGSCGFHIYRHNCEIADQWSAIEIPAFSGEGRESLAMKSTNRRVKDGIRKPLRRWMAEIVRPMYLFDEGQVNTRAYDFEGRLWFVHELINVTHGNVVARVVEEI